MRSAPARGVGTRRSDPVRVYWWSPVRVYRDLAFELKEHPASWVTLLVRTRRFMANFGDELSGVIVGSTLRRRVSWSPPGQADLFAIGSILQIGLREARPGAAIWGSGLREGIVPSDGRVDGLHVLALRGEQTRRALGSCEVALGDPAILSGEVYAQRPRQRAGISYVPHFTEFASRAGRTFIGRLRDAGLKIIPPSLPANDVVYGCASSDVVISSSLHGLVVADALGIPALPAIPSPPSNEPRFKYTDYESIYGVDDAPIEAGGLLSGTLSVSRVSALADERRQKVARSIDDRKQALTAALESRLL